MYLIYSIKYAGWYGKTGQFVSDAVQARRYDRDRAIALCTMQLSQESLGAIPVAEADIEEVLL